MKAEVRVSAKNEPVPVTVRLDVRCSASRPFRTERVPPALKNTAVS
jgi:hypothetical protein